MGEEQLVSVGFPRFSEMTVILVCVSWPYIIASWELLPVCGVALVQPSCAVCSL